MDDTTVLEVTRTLIGEIEPCGDSVIDMKRSENLNVMLDVIDGLLEDVEKVAINKNRSEYSIQMMGKGAYTALGLWRKRLAKIEGKVTE